MPKNIHIAVLDVDIPARQLYEARGLCSAHFRDILHETASRLNEGHPANPFNVKLLRGHVSADHPPVAKPIDAILITGGSPGVYEMSHSPWMQILSKFIKKVFDEYPEVRILGTCFGHQLIGEVGIHTVQMEQEFLKAFPHALGHLPKGQLRIQMFHGDRVMAVEKGTPRPPERISSCLAPCAVDQCRVLSVQGHYEMDAFGMKKMCVESAPSFGWKESKLSLFLEQVGPDLKERQDDAKAFATAVVCFLAELEQ
ncbi:hypothetical protein N7468_003587 [Penicillium chermesinum]|uniref:Glutamine amidotransferase domain-containing protein n=1 Tax=Penicillium chermesinum TaxID=63820 RepID=A0A9W9P6T1_9EURO|nr:uncharacterized protein N7468_003587 [Penicillium chermesinum]KAJ5238968.1 hypothetical protein N7468_003587 [Penicillium chermesinum]